MNHDAITTYWDEVRARVGSSVLGQAALRDEPPSAWAFGDHPALADELLALVLAGVKTGTSSAVAHYGPGENLPVAGDLSILLDGSGTPRALIRTTNVQHTRFCDVSAEFAHSEGEDDRSLASWRREHHKFFERVLPGSFSEDMPIVCETFEVLA